MKKRTSLGALRDKLYVKALFYPRVYRIRKSTKQRLRNIGGGAVLSYAEKREINLFWEKYGVKVKPYWYKLFFIRAEHRIPTYIPDDLYYSKILPKLNNILHRRAYTDKCFSDRIFPSVKRPKTIIKNSHGIYYDGSGNIIDLKQAIEILQRADSFLIKPALDTGSGRLINICEAESPETVSSIVKQYKNNFIAQEIQSQHADLALIHAQSLNTIRVISLLFKEEVHILSSVLRMGSGGARLDNISAGGYACPVNLSDGKLFKEAVNRKSEWVTRHDSGTVFGEFTVPSFAKIIAKVKELHQGLPHFSLIGWDFAVDQEGDPVFIEFNVSPEPNQISCGPTFGDLTEEVLTEIFIKKSYDEVNE